MVLAVRTRVSALRSKVAPESRFLAKMLTVPGNPLSALPISISSAMPLPACAPASVIIVNVSKRGHRMRTIVPFVLAFAIPAVLIAQPGAPPQIGFIEKKIADGTENLQDRITLMNLYLNARNVEKRREP